MRLFRNDFPAVLQRASWRQPVYLDNAGATLPVNAALLQADETARLGPTAAVGAVEAARAAFAAFAGAAEPEQVVFTKSATEALNLIAFCYAAQVLSPGGAVALPIGEHMANFLPWQRAATAAGAELIPIPCGEDGKIAEEDIIRCIRPGTKIVTFSEVSHLLGTPLPVEALLRQASAVGAVTVLDACQSARLSPARFAALGVDFAVFSGAKLYGPAGIGVLCGRRALLEAMPPLFMGEGAAQSGDMAGFSLAPAPGRFEAGGQNAPCATGLSAAANYLQTAGLEEVAAQIEALTAYALEGLVRIPGVRLLGGPDAPRMGIISFTAGDMPAAQVAGCLADAGVFIASGTLAAAPLLRRMGFSECCRVSFGVYNTAQDVDSLLTALAGICAPFG